jgi:hypothetical protein
MESRFVRDEELCGFDFHLPDCVRGRYWLAVAGCDPVDRFRSCGFDFRFTPLDYAW